MGGQPTYRTDCYHCSYSVCRDGCDDCSSCAENMAEHRRLRRLESTFIDKVYESREKTRNKCISELNDLKENYGIYIYYYPYSNDLDCAKEILDKMEEKKNDIVSNMDKFEIDKNSYYFKTERLNQEHELRMKKIRYDFEEKLAAIQIQKENETLNYNNKINEEKKQKEKLEENKEKLDLEKYINVFIKEKNSEFDKKYEKQKSRIDSKYPSGNLPEPILEYTEEEKNQKNLLLKNIRVIKNYSYLPNYNLLIKKFDLVNDL